MSVNENCTPAEELHPLKTWLTGIQESGTEPRLSLHLIARTARLPKIIKPNHGGGTVVKSELICQVIFLRFRN